MGTLEIIFSFLGETWDGMWKSEQDLKVQVKDKIKSLISSGIFQNKNVLDAQS